MTEIFISGLIRGMCKECLLKGSDGECMNPEVNPMERRERAIFDLLCTDASYANRDGKQKPAYRVYATESAVWKTVPYEELIGRLQENHK